MPYRHTYMVIPVSCLLFGVGTWVVQIPRARAASSSSTSAASKSEVVNGVGIAVTRHLTFGEATQGTGGMVILPAAGNSAQMTVSGDAGHVYNITLPVSATMLRAGGTPGTAADEILVNAFTSTPSASSTLSGVGFGGGTETLNVGATRAAIPESQAPGIYSASFTVTVAYP
jgi:hypothetical protein